MYNIIGVDADDVILDTCTGSGGFIATGFGKLIDANKQKGRNVEVDSEVFKNITEKQLLAIENSPNMYSLAFSNMILHGDGKSNLYQGDCFDKKFDDIIKPLKPTLGIINTPYNDKAAPFFMKRLLELLEYGGKAIIIAPSNCLVQDAETTEKILSKHTLKAIIKLNGKIFTSQSIGVQTSLYVFEAHKSHNNQDVYFYDFSDDGYYNFYTEKGNCLTIDSAVAGSCFYQEKDFSASDHVEVLRPKDNRWSKNALFFIKTLIDIKIRNQFNYSIKCNQKTNSKNHPKIPIV